MAKVVETGGSLDAVSGGVIRPGDAGYDDARKVWNGMIDIRPAAIARCLTVEDVRRAVAFGQENGLELSIRGGGHNAAGLGVVEDGLVIDLSGMRAVAVDPAAKTAAAQGGATWSDFDRATTAHDLATTGGAVSTTGVGGLTLGGGIGNLMRQYGLACDNLISAQVVLANGDVVETSATENADLFWALRGGGGNFGVVTEFRYRLHPMHGLYGGMILHPRAKAKSILSYYRVVARDLPFETGLFVGLLNSPEGDPLIGYLPWHNGTQADGERTLADLKRYEEPIADMTAFTPYVGVQSGLDEAFPAGLQVYWKSHFLSGLPEEAVDTIIDFANRAPSPLTVTLLETMGGKVATVGIEETAFEHRHAPYNLAIISRWIAPEEAEANIAWTRAFHDAMQPWASGVYVNYLGAGDAPDRVRDAYSPEKYKRLLDVKRKYDPANVFHRNQNIQ